MWMMSSNSRPYLDRPHDVRLVSEIISGLRPAVVQGTSVPFEVLMKSCLNHDQSNRPTADRLNECLENWITSICDDSEPSELSDQFDESELIKFKRYEKLRFGKYLNDCSDERAIYFSRPLDSFIQEAKD